LSVFTVVGDIEGVFVGDIEGVFVGDIVGGRDSKGGEGAEGGSSTFYI